jgi:DNA-binding LacI/PurR family transcriptional regulator
MTLIPQRTVASQIAAQLRTEIEKRTWRGWLPTERVLCQKMRASRNTIRAAIAQLKAEGLIVSKKPVGNWIETGSRRLRKGAQPRSVGIVIPETVNKLRPLISLWIDELKDMLIAEDCHVRVHDGQQYYRANPGNALDRLVNQNAHDAWVLVLSSKAMQQWFARRSLPCLVAGSIYPEVELPFCDLDYRAVCRHAVGVLLRLGHRRIGLLNHQSPRAGEIASELGFSEGVRASASVGVMANIVYHDDDVDSIARALKKLRGSKAGFPTAVIVNSSYAYLSVISLLASQRLQVPQDVSLISRDDDPLLDAIFPAPARYTVSPHAFARRLIGPTLDLLGGLPVSRPQTYFLPKFISGGSTAAPRD